MAAIITLEGIDNAISSLNYRNKNTLKYRYIHQIRQYYSNENSVESVGKIDNETLINILWDTGGSPEVIKKKRKNLNSLRSSVNADLKKLYLNGENSEGVKIGPDNIFVMLDDAKDKILKEFGYDLKPDGILKLDKIMDILRLAKETVSGSMAVEEKIGKDGLRKIDQLKSLIKGLSEKVGLSTPELSETDHKTEGALEESKAFEKVDDSGGVPDEITGEKGAQEIIEELEEDEFLEKVEELEEDEVLEAVDESEDLADEIDEANEIEENLEEIEELEEDEILESVDELEEVTEEISEADEIEENLEEIEELEEDEVLEAADELEEVTEEIPEADEIEENLDEIEELEEDEILESVDELEEVTEEIPEVDEIEENLEEIEELEEDEIIEAIEDADLDELVEVPEDNEAVGGRDDLQGAGIDGGFGEGSEHFEEHKDKYDIEEAERAEESESIGLPVDSLGQDYSVKSSEKIKKNRLLAEEFDGYLGVMDRYYNHYILIPGGQYIVGAKKPKRDEKFEQLISLSPFYIGRFPVTNCLFEIFIEKTGYRTVAEKVGYGNVYYGRCQRKKDEKTGLISSIWNSSLYCKIVEGACWYQPFGPGSTLHNKRNHPVVQISLDDAMAFAAWTGKRLPTEDEWEAAARTEKAWIFPWGKNWKKHCCNIEDSFVGDTTPVEKYAEFENDFGIVDTMGNVLEWTSANFTALSDSKNRSGCHIAKGGSWISGDDIRLFSRFKTAPESHSNILGFRCVAY